MEKFCSEEEFLSIVIDGKEEVFNEVLSRVFIKGVETALLYLPEASDALMKKLAYTNKLYGKFIDNHPEYKEHKTVVLQVVQRVELENPTCTMEEVLEKAAVEIERELKLAESLKGVV